MHCTCTADHVCARCDERADLPPGGVTDREAEDRAADREEDAFWARGEW
jgi:hypothetical protein